MATALERSPTSQEGTSLVSAWIVVHVQTSPQPNSPASIPKRASRQLGRAAANDQFHRILPILPPATSRRRPHPAASSRGNGATARHPPGRRPAPGRSIDCRFADGTAAPAEEHPAAAVALAAASLVGARAGGRSDRPPRRLRRPVLLGGRGAPQRPQRGGQRKGPAHRRSQPPRPRPAGAGRPRPEGGGG